MKNKCCITKVKYTEPAEPDIILPPNINFCNGGGSCAPESEPQVPIPGIDGKTRYYYVVRESIGNPDMLKFNCFGYAAGVTKIYNGSDWKGNTNPDPKKYNESEVDWDKFVKFWKEGDGTPGFRKVTNIYSTKGGNGKQEKGYEKIAFYGYDEKGVWYVTHAARQIDDGTWISKVGKFLIRHPTAESLSIKAYGPVLGYGYIKK